MLKRLVLLISQINISFIQPRCYYIFRNALGSIPELDRTKHVK
jgi:hypothetical protein